MPKSKQPPPRKTVKAKGALPSPVTAPIREEIPWYKQRKNQAIIAVVVVFLTVFAVKTWMDLAEQADDRERRSRTLGQFERRIQLLNAELPEIFQQVSDSPGAYLAGSLPQEEFQQQADGWVESFRELQEGIRSTEVPEDMEKLIEAKGLFLQSALIYTDAAKTFALAPSIQDAAIREDTLVLARNELIHGSGVLAMAERRFVDAQNELGVNDPPADLPPVQFPEEESPIVPPAPEPAPQVSPLPAESPAAEAGPEPVPTAGDEESAEQQPAG